MGAGQANTTLSKNWLHSPSLAELYVTWMAPSRPTDTATTSVPTFTSTPVHIRSNTTPLLVSHVSSSQLPCIGMMSCSTGAMAAGTLSMLPDRNVDDHTASATVSQNIADMPMHRHSVRSGIKFKGFSRWKV